MAAVGPFEPQPHLAVAVSGGADSMALCLLAQRWAGARGGWVTALTVDHGLRSGSRAEADQVGCWLNGRGIAHAVLPWIGAKPATGIQEAARVARYRLLARWCADAGVLHVLLGHHQFDQAETVLMRQARGSGVDGLAGMVAVVETADVRLVRPLLRTAPSRLRALLTAAGQAWIEDPTNVDPAHARNRVRARLAGLPAGDQAVATVMAASETMGAARAALESAAATLLARCCTLSADGYARLEAPLLASAPAAVATRALGRVLGAVGGLPYAPSVGKLERAWGRLVENPSPTAATLGRCRLARAGDSVLVCREGRNLPAPQVPPANGSVYWDDRFEIELSGAGEGRTGPIRLVALGADGARRVGHAAPRARSVPRQAWAALPALADDVGVLEVPHLGYERGDGATLPLRFRSALFRPRRPLSGTGRYLA